MQRNRGKQLLGKTSDLFKEIRDTKGTFHAKMGSINDRNGMDLTEAEDIKKRWQQYTEEMYKKDLHDPDSQYQNQIDYILCSQRWRISIQWNSITSTSFVCSDAS